MGLVQIFRASPCPPLMARHLLSRELRDWRKAARRYFLHLVLSRVAAERHGNTQDIERFEDEIKEHLIREQIPEHWQLEYLFSEAGYEEHGLGIFPWRALALLHLCTLERSWRQVLQGDRSTDPYRMSGFALDEPMWSTDWLEDFRRVWTMELRHVDGELWRYLH